MRGAEQVVAELRARGELWDAAPGLTGLRGDVRHLRRRVERALAALDASEGAEEWSVPAALSLETLARADYFASFPQWLTLAAHLREDAAALEAVARSDRPAQAARAAAAPAAAALPPAVCYHVYAALADSTLDRTRVVGVQGTCWRHEGARLRPLARGWAFTMRETVCLGAAPHVAALRARGAERALAFARALGLPARLEAATDPFFAPTARGQALLQRVKGLKQELLLGVGAEELAASSFNLHEEFFGDAFAIRAADGAPAASGCVAHGVERWLLAVLSTHGCDPRGWPPIQTSLPREVPA